MIVRLEDKLKSLEKINKEGKFFDTYSTGLHCLDEIYKVVKGYPLFIAGAPHNGKSEFSLELAISLSINHKFKWCCYLGEAGKTEIVIAEICSKFIGKYYFHLTDSDRAYAYAFISEHFIFIESEILTFKGFYDEVGKAEQELGIKFTGTILDPFNDVKNETGEHGGRTDIWLENDLTMVKHISQKNNRVDIIVTHVKDIASVKDNDSGNMYRRPAMANEWSMGQVWERKGFTMLLVYKVPEFIKDENGVPYGKNKTLIYNQKAKPKGSGRIGSCVLNWDWKANRYFEEIGGFKKYMLEKSSNQAKPLLPNSDFMDKDSLPF